MEQKKEQSIIKKKSEARILVVDDDRFILSLIVNQLSIDNYKLFSVLSAEEALKIIKKEEEFDLIIIDVMMPDINGYELASKIRETYSLFELPILMLTAKSQVVDMLNGFDSGANDYLAKPFNNDELLARTRTLVKLKKLTKANTVLQEAMEMKNQFINMTIHDLRNPLSVIKGVIDLFRVEVDFKEDQIDLLDMIQAASSSMISLVEELLNAAKIESGKIALKKVDVDFIDIVEDVINKNCINAEKKHQKIIFQASRNINYTMAGDTIRLQEIIENLISNAIKYSPFDKNIHISISNTKAPNNRPYIRFSVKDEGPGLTEDDLKKVFGTFQRLSAQPTDNENSSGLGLSIVKQLVELHKGKIWVESIYGEGAEFIFELPLEN